MAGVSAVVTFASALATDTPPASAAAVAELAVEVVGRVPVPAAFASHPQGVNLGDYLAACTCILMLCRNLLLLLHW